jgi:hypothetical protein
LKRDKSLAVTYVNDEIGKCEKDLKPLQDIVDGWLAIETGGISSLLPGKMGHIDVSDMLAGYPLGGPDALIPHAREQVFKALGIGGDFKKVIENPLGGPCSVIHKPFGC